MPGKLDDSELYQRITSTDPDERMPPPKSGKTLSAAEIAKLKTWIEAGGRVSGALGVPAPRAPAAARGEERGLVPYADRPVHPGPARSRGTQAVARGRQGHA